MRNTRSIRKRDLILNHYQPRIEVDPLELARFHLREIENVVDDREERVRAVARVLQLAIVLQSLRLPLLQRA